MKPLVWALAPPDLTRWRVGNTGVEGVWRFDSGTAGRNVLITALVHGNELCGAWAVLDLLSSGLRPRCGVLTLALCNLAAFASFDARAPDASRFVEMDLNRVWGAGLMGGDSLEHCRARELAPFVECADWLLDLHSMHEPGPPLLLTGPLARPCVEPHRRGGPVRSGVVWQRRCRCERSAPGGGADPGVAKAARARGDACRRRAKQGHPLCSSLARRAADRARWHRAGLA